MIRETKTNNLDFIAGKLTPCLRAAIDKGFAGVDWAKIEADFWTYVGQLQ